MADELPMLYNDPRRITIRWFSKGRLDLMRKEYESQIQRTLDQLEQDKQVFIKSFDSESEIAPDRAMLALQRHTQDLCYWRQCLDAVNKSVPRAKGEPKGFWC